MTERLYIENFLGIKKLEIEVKKFNIIIGPQASGKSVCAKLLFFFKSFVPNIIDIVLDDKTKMDLDKEYEETFKEYFPHQSWGSNSFYLKYQTNEHCIEIQKTSASEIYIKYSDAYEKELEELKQIKKKFDDDNFNIGYHNKKRGGNLQENLINHARNKLTLNSTFNAYFISAERSFFSTFDNNIYSFLLKDKSLLDPFLMLFGEQYKYIKNLRNSMGFKIDKRDKNINKLAEDILCGTYIYEKGEDLLEIADGRKINLSISSSGQQEILPVILILSTMNFLFPTGKGCTFYIEEPEAHLFPKAQKQIVELMSIVFNNHKNKKDSEFQFFITTHSPYILTSLNNLIQAGSLYKTLDENQQKELSKIVPKSQAIDLDDIAVYSLENGKCISIISEETELIDTNIIDNVSNDLAIEFDKLLDFL